MRPATDVLLQIEARDLAVVRKAGGGHAGERTTVRGQDCVESHRQGIAGVIDGEAPIGEDGARASGDHRAASKANVLLANTPAGCHVSTCPV